MDLKVLGEQQFNIASCAGSYSHPNEARAEVAVMFLRPRFSRPAKANAFASAVVLDEINTGGFERSAQGCFISQSDSISRSTTSARRMVATPTFDARAKSRAVHCFCAAARIRALVFHIGIPRLSYPIPYPPNGVLLVSPIDVEWDALN